MTAATDRPIYYSRWWMPSALQGIGGPARDERWATIARGEDGSPCSQLGAVGGLVDVVSVVLLRRRT